MDWRSLGFHKSRILFGLPQARFHSRMNKEIIFVEGYMDAVSLYEIGMKNAVSPMGTAVTKHQLSLAADLCGDNGTIVLLLDNDSAGESAMMRVKSLLARWVGKEKRGKAVVRAVDWSSLASAQSVLEAEHLSSVNISSIKDCGDLCTMMSPLDARKVIRYMIATARDIGEVPIEYG